MKVRRCGDYEIENKKTKNVYLVSQDILYVTRIIENHIIKNHLIKIIKNYLIKIIKKYLVKLIKNY